MSQIAVYIDGSVVHGIHIKNISLTLDNQLRATEAIGSNAPVEIKKGTANITGTIKAYLSAESFDWYGRSLNQASISRLVG